MRSDSGQVLSTDMSKHFHFLGEFKTLLKATHELGAHGDETGPDQTYDPMDAIAEVRHDVLRSISTRVIRVCVTLQPLSGLGHGR